MTNENQTNAMYVATQGTINGNLGQITYNTGTNTVAGSGYSSIVSCWDYWQNLYYPQVIRESYPVYIQNRSEDKGKHAFEIIKQLQDKRLMKLEKVSDFIDAMDCLIKIL